MNNPFQFANYTIILGFLISWGVWILLEHTAFKYGWIDISDGFIITCIFTISSYIRLFIMGHIFHNKIRKDEKSKWINLTNK